ncbi:MAG: ABC transporter ATP-binding protein, partial [Desulfurococcaceae archaeon]
QVMSDPLLYTVNLVKRFGGIRALDGVNFSVERGVIKGLIGPNGSGKTTLINCITGVVRPDSGKVIFNGLDITDRPPHQVAKIGIARTWQIVRPFKKMSIIDAVTTAALVRVREIERARGEAESILQMLGFSRETMKKRGSEITLMQHKIVDLARALALKPALLFIDEIAAGLRPAEVDELVKILKNVHEEMGITMVVVEHLMTFIMKISDVVSVMHEGKLIAEGAPEEISKNPKVIEVYLGMRV